MNLLAKIAFFFFVPGVLFAQVPDPFQYTVDQSARTVFRGGETPVEITFLIPPSHYLYKDKMALTVLEGEGYELGPIVLSPAAVTKDPFTGADEQVYFETAVLNTHLRPKAGAPEGETTVKLQLEYQGCSDKLCFRLTRKEIAIPVTLGRMPSSGPSEPLFQDPLTLLKKKGLLVALLITFLGGLGSAFTPCVLPIIPITLAFIGVRKQGTTIAHNFILSLFLVLSMSLTYAAMGLAASLVGKSLGFLFQNPYFLSFGVLLYAAMSLSLFGLFEIQAPLGMRNFLAKLGGSGVVGSILSGFTVGFLAAPCVGPVIASLLLYVAKERDAAHGFLLLFAYGFGMGSLFLVVGTFYHRLASKVHGGPFTVWIKRVFAVLLLVPAFYYGSIVYAQFTGKAVVGPVAHNAFWVRSVAEGFQSAQTQTKPVFLDFFASWCLPCVEMENGTFSDKNLQKYLTEHFVPIKVDCTDETPDCKAMTEKYGVVGWPTFLVLSPDGKVLQSFIGQKLSASELKARLDVLVASPAETQ
ncbi:MAG TPA: cytochrome c biogenesis protein CcdA [bacterium]|nr:cytochrome c biogenesis protein CcdA [bacterium]